MIHQPEKVTSNCITKIKLIGLLLLTVTLGFASKNYYTINAGIGTDKLFVGQKVKNVFSLLGKNDKYTEGIIDYENREAIHINRYIYLKFGLTFVTYTDESKSEDLANARVDNILFEIPAIAKTNENITLGIDTKEKIISAIGQPDRDKDFYSDVTYLHYRQKGISFCIDDKTNKISIIEVYRRNGHPENN